MTKLTTEKSSNYDELEKMSPKELLMAMNQEDLKVANSVKEALPQITRLSEAICHSLKVGGRLFYIGAGTSGRLGILDASECPPTYGVPHDLVTGIIAGGDGAIRKAVEGAEDDTAQGLKDLLNAGAKKGDVVVGITASGKTPYVLGAVEQARSHGLVTGGISCNPNSRLSALVDHPIEIVTGPEFVTGSTRMKAGTAQKLVLNMLSTSAMISLGRVKGNKMIDMQLSNNKLKDRGTLMLVETLNISEKEARTLLLENGSVRNAMNAYGNR